MERQGGVEVRHPTQWWLACLAVCGVLIQEEEEEEEATVEKEKKESSDRVRPSSSVGGGGPSLALTSGPPPPPPTDAKGERGRRRRRRRRPRPRSRSLSWCTKQKRRSERTDGRRPPRALSGGRGGRLRSHRRSSCLPPSSTFPPSHSTGVNRSRGNLATGPTERDLSVFLLASLDRATDIHTSPFLSLFFGGHGRHPKKKRGSRT